MGGNAKLSSILLLLMGSAFTFTPLQETQIPYLDVQNGTVVVKYASTLSEIPTRTLKPMNTPSFNVATVEAVPGQETTVAINLANPDFTLLVGVEAIVVYDASVLQVLGIQSGSAIPGDWFSYTAIVSNWAAFASTSSSFSGVMVEGNICNLRVAVNSAATPGTFAPIAVFDGALIDDMFNFIAFLTNSGGVQVIGVVQPPPDQPPSQPPESPLPPQTFTDPVQQYLNDNLTTNSSSGTTQLVIPQGTTDGTTDSDFSAKTKDFLDQLQSGLTFTSSTYTSQTDNYQAGDSTYTLITVLG